MARKHPADQAENLSEGHGGSLAQQVTGLGGLVHGLGEVLSGDGGQHGCLAPAGAAVDQLHADGDVLEALEPGRGDREGRKERDVERAALGSVYFNCEGIEEGRGRW